MAAEDKDTTAGPTRQDTARITVELDGNDLGVFDKLTGGAVDSDDNKYYPGGMGAPVSLGGRKTVDNVVVSRLYRLVRDHSHIGKWIDGVGKAKGKITKHPMDINGNVWGNPLVYVGRLKRVTPPEIDSEASGAALVEMEFIIDGFPTHSPE